MKNLAIHCFLDEIDAVPSEALAAGQASGVAAYGLRILPSGRFPEIDETDWTWLQDRTKSGEMTVSFVSPATNKVPFDPAGLDAIKEGVTRALDRGRTLGARSLTLFSWMKPASVRVTDGATLSPDMPQGVVDAMGRYAELAASFDMDLLVECGYDAWGDTNRAVAALVWKVGHPRMGLIFEACNEYRGCLKWKIGSETALRSDPTELLIDSLIQVAPLVRDVHVRDAVPTNDGEWVPLGEGVIDWARLLAALDGCNYSGPLTVEHHLPAKQAATKHTVDTLRALIQAI